MYPMYNETPWPKLTAKSVNMQNDRAATLLHVYPTNALDVAARPSAARTPIGRTVLEHGRAPVKFRTSKRHRILADHVMSEGYSEQLETTKKTTLSGTLVRDLRSLHPKRYTSPDPMSHQTCGCGRCKGTQGAAPGWRPKPRPKSGPKPP